MRLLFSPLIIIIFCCNSYGFSFECVGLFKTNDKKAQLEYELVSTNNYSGHIKQLKTLHFTNGVHLYQLTIHGEYQKYIWSKNPSPYVRASEVITAYFGKLKLESEQGYYIFNEQGSRQLFEAYQKHINSPTDNTPNIKTYEEIKSLQEEKLRSGNLEALTTIQSKNKSVVPRNIKKHVVSFYQANGVIFVRITDFYKDKSKSDFYLTYVKSNTQLKTFNSLVQILSSYNGFKKESEELFTKKLRSYHFEIPKDHPLFYVQQEIKKQSSWFKKIFNY